MNIPNLKTLNNSHHNQLCFILGSGCSLSNVDLNSIRQHVVFTVNSSCVAAPWANYFVSDDWSASSWNYFTDLQKSDTTVLLYEDKLKQHATKFKKPVLFRHRKGYEITDFYDHELKSHHICQARTSLGSAIHIAHIMGCSPIVLLGVDCCRNSLGHRYFWETWSNKPVRIVPSMQKFHQIVKNGVKTDNDLDDILKYWNFAAKYFNEKCEIYNASETSIIECFKRKKISDFV